MDPNPTNDQEYATAIVERWLDPMTEPGEFALVPYHQPLPVEYAVSLICHLKFTGGTRVELNFLNARRVGWLQGSAAERLSTIAQLIAPILEERLLARGFVRRPERSDEPFARIWDYHHGSEC